MVGVVELEVLVLRGRALGKGGKWSMSI